MTNYFTLITRATKSEPWAIAFGDYDRAAVVQEIEDSYSDELTKIFNVGDDNLDIMDQVARENRIPAGKDDYAKFLCPDDYLDQEEEERIHGREGIEYCGELYATTEDAMIVAGGDTLASLEGETKYRNEEYWIETQDGIEARQGPAYYFPPADIEIPF